jgi:hypothetical protein
LKECLPLWGGRPRPRRTPWSGSERTEWGRRGRRPADQGVRPTVRVLPRTEILEAL